MYHNDGSAGYIHMAHGTVPPKTYERPIYCVLLPQAMSHTQMFLSKNGAVLVYGDVPASHLNIVDQMPISSLNILRPGRGHKRPSSITGATWPRGISYERVMQEKGNTLFVVVQFQVLAESLHGSS